jgi:leishmanolysin-like peptidase
MKGPSIEGVDLEDEGGSGSLSSHWERSMLHNEMMCASTLPDEAFSDFTLALLEDSGWYKPDYSYAVR